MIYFMSYDIFKNHSEDLSSEMIILNLSSPIEKYNKLRNLLNFKFNTMNDKEFDMNYYKFIMTNTNAFLDLMKIIINIYYGKDVVILIGSDRNYDDIPESLSKLISERYGLLPFMIFEEDDMSILNRFINDGFSVQGLNNFDRDKVRYISLMRQIYGDDKLNVMSNYLNNNFR